MPVALAFLSSIAFAFVGGVWFGSRAGRPPDAAPVDGADSGVGS